MVTQREALEVIKHALESHDRFPSEMSYLLHEADPDGTDANVSVPVVEMQSLTVTEDNPSNDNLHEFLTDSSGNRVGRVYENKWEMELQMNIWTAQGSDNDVDALGRRLREILYTYDSRGPNQDFVNDKGNTVKSIYDFSLQEGERNDSLIETPSVRIWQQTARVRGAEYLTLTADEQPVTSVNETVDTT